ncbi:hypothetical protein M011DRAFT_522825 [Sporormia fimetaria CBS 119925]|uniref:Uncharacterized protein n=1 Tax=Sporormia fimetaria CBS 119925 TaxID=1340428 RepID=A0A6A6VMZ6_9PLEO|nr:hypothetical protein M011DRAFT_522825 [Sporormia fimetaria CBS 119925]
MFAKTIFLATVATFSVVHAAMDSIKGCTDPFPMFTRHGSVDATGSEFCTLASPEHRSHIHSLRIHGGENGGIIGIDVMHWDDTYEEVGDKSLRKDRHRIWVLTVSEYLESQNLVTKADSRVAYGTGLIEEIAFYRTDNSVSCMPGKEMKYCKEAYEADLPYQNHQGYVGQRLAALSGKFSQDGLKYLNFHWLDPGTQTRRSTFVSFRA